MGTEHRKFTRFKVAKNVFAALGPSFSKVGRIIDVSVGGLAIEYISDENSALKTSFVDIFIREEEYFVPKLPCKIVYDDPIDPPRDHQVSEVSRNRCGVQFHQFTSVDKNGWRVCLNSARVMRSKTILCA